MVCTGNPDSFGSVNPDPEVKNKWLFSPETAGKRPEEQTEGGCHRRYSPDELENQKFFFTLNKGSFEINFVILFV